MRAAGLALAPTFIPFTPWTTREGYREFLARSRTSTWPTRGAHSTGDPAADSGRLAAAGTAGSAGDGRAVRRARPVLSVAQQRPRRGRALRAHPEIIKREERRRASRSEIFRKIWDMAQAAPGPSRRCRRGRPSRI